MIKRLFDLLVATIILLVFSPVWALVVLLIYVESGNPVYFKQVRCGKGLRRFNLIKFRTMQNGRHKVVNLLHDHRVTRIGRVLRASGLDSLPELLNVLKGDMSIVGPRPMPYAVEDEPKYSNIEKIPGHYLRSQVRPGMTGLAQVFAGKFVSRRIKFRYDNLYVQRQCFCLDFKILAITFLRTIGRDWESR
jgi:undecaprenyl phosphate N,N'-diacetylbacillosamine 1-phosphate transferase